MPPRKPSKGDSKRKLKSETSDTKGTPEKRRRVEAVVAALQRPTEKGIALTCGEGDAGQLGLGEDKLERKRPAVVSLPEKVVQVCCGGMHSACLTETGHVYTWGCNDDGALGHGGDEFTPAEVTLPAPIAYITAGDSHTSALSEDGRLFVWGDFRDGSGPIGLNPKGRSTEPVEMPFDAKVVRVASGTHHVACLTEDGNLFTFGVGEQGQLGRLARQFADCGSRRGKEPLLTPTLVRCRVKRTQAKFSHVWASAYATFAQLADTKRIVGFGLNNFCQLGLEDRDNRYVPEELPAFGEKGWSRIVGGLHHTLALDGEGQLFAMGRHDFGRLGVGQVSSDCTELTPVKNLHGVKPCATVSCSDTCSFATTTDGAVFSWGMGNQQLGQAEEEDLAEPVQIVSQQTENKFILQVSAGGQHTLFISKAE